MGQRYNKWDEAKTQRFIELYPATSKKDMCTIFNMKPASVLSKGYKLGVKVFNPYIVLSDSDKEYILSNHRKISMQEISVTLNKSLNVISNFLYKNGYGKDAEWQAWELDILRKYYPYHPNRYILDNYLPHRSITKIRMRGLKLGLHKETKVPKKYDKDEVIERLKQVYQEIGRIPLERELVKFGLPSEKTFARYLGNYLDVCKSLGMPCGLRLFGRSTRGFSNGGHLCGSLSEREITEFFEDNGFNFTKENYYRDYIDDKRCGNRRFDWIINGNIFVEFFGLDSQPEYKTKMNFKIALCKEHNINLICLYKKDLNKLHEIFNVNP